MESTTVIRPRKGWNGFDLGELWDARELVVFFAWRTILIRYKQTVLGIAWAVLQPLALMLVLIVVSGGLTKTVAPGTKPSGAVYILAGLVPWTFFASALSQSSNSLVGQAALLTKVYFPRLVPPVAAVVAALVDLLIAFGLFLVVMLVVPATHGPRIAALWLVPGFTLLALVTALGIGLWLSALNVAYRDVQYLVPFVVQIGMFASVLFPVTVASGWKHTVLGLNPMAGVVEGFRYALAGGPRPGSLVLVSAIFSLTLLVTGLAYFKRRERTFVDVI